jgi:hypothetical protein
MLPSELNTVLCSITVPFNVCISEIEPSLLNTVLTVSLALYVSNIEPSDGNVVVLSGVILSPPPPPLSIASFKV